MTTVSQLTQVGAPGALCHATFKMVPHPQPSRRKFKLEMLMG